MSRFQFNMIMFMLHYIAGTVSPETARAIFYIASVGHFAFAMLFLALDAYTSWNSLPHRSVSEPN